MFGEKQNQIIKEIKKKTDYELDEPITFQSFSSILDQIVK